MRSAAVAEQDPADAGYTQLVCGSSDEDGDAATDGVGWAAGARELEESGTAADRLLHMLEADYHRCLDADQSARHEPGAEFVASGVDEATSGGGSPAPAEESKGTGAASKDDSETNEDGADRPHNAGSEAWAASIDGDSNGAATAEFTGRAAGGSQAGAFAQAVAGSRVDDVRAAMAGISLPPDAWPAWARDVGEKELLDRLRANAK